MSANPSSHQSAPAAGVPASRRPARLMWLLFLAGAATVAVFWGPRLAELVPTDPRATAMVPAVTVVAAGVVAVVALLLVVARRSRRLRRQRTHNALAWFEALHVSGAVQVRSATMSPVGDTENRSERVLRLQVRSLERALEGQDQRVAEAARAGQRTALLTLAALRESLAHQPGAIALGRVEAALGRVVPATAFDRPTLTAGPSGALLVGFGAPQSLVPAAVHASDAAPVPVVEAATADVAVPDAPVETPVAPAEPVADSAPTAPVRPVVKPVPAPAPREVPHRSRRRLRRTVAA